MLIETYRALRVLANQLIGVEPLVRTEVRVPLEFHGNNYCGWEIPQQLLRPDSLIVDVGLGEDVSFTQSLISRYSCKVHGFDPTPRSIQFVQRLGEPGLILHKFAVAAKRGEVEFYLPNDSANVSGSLQHAAHVGSETLKVQALDLNGVIELIGDARIDLLKIDIEGAEYELIESESFAQNSPNIACLCIEFHHRWEIYGKAATKKAVERLHELGFRCAWKSRTSNEEFTFINMRSQSA